MNLVPRKKWYLHDSWTECMKTTLLALHNKCRHPTHLYWPEKRSSKCNLSYQLDSEWDQNCSCCQCAKWAEAPLSHHCVGSHQVIHCSMLLHIFRKSNKQWNKGEEKVIGCHNLLLGSGISKPHHEVIKPNKILLLSYLGLQELFARGGALDLYCLLMLLWSVMGQLNIVCICLYCQGKREQ